MAAVSASAAADPPRLVAGGEVTFATAVSPTGQVVGQACLPVGCFDAVPAMHAFSWTQAGGMVDLGTLGGRQSWPVAVSPSGQVVGASYLAADAGYHAFSW